MKTDRQLFKMVKEYSRTNEKNSGVQRRQLFKHELIDRTKELNPGRCWDDSTDDTIIWQELQNYYPTYQL